MKTLYLSDLDGTLLRSNERVSEYTAKTINRFIMSGGCFSYATARSIVTASKVTSGLLLSARNDSGKELKAEFPVICHNGALIIGNKTGEVLLSHSFSKDDAESILHTLIANNISPVVYAYIDGAERFSFMERGVSVGMRHFLNSRLNDPRRREVQSERDLYCGNIYYFACISDTHQLAPINEIFKTDSQVNCIYQKDVYSDAQWCELLPVKATKATAALELKSMLNCDKLVVFGDGLNDISMFSVADECYAMANAVPDLKELATAVIDTNDNDGVAKWIEINT